VIFSIMAMPDSEKPLKSGQAFMATCLDMPSLYSKNRHKWARVNCLRSWLCWHGFCFSLLTTVAHGRNIHSGTV
jgi:hypothetical protein